MRHRWDARIAVYCVLLVWCLCLVLCVFERPVFHSSFLCVRRECSYVVGLVASFCHVQCYHDWLVWLSAWSVVVLRWD